MGSYLSKPKLEKTSEDFDSNNRYDCGLSGMQGWRSNMEDSHNCIPDVDENMGFFGVYDGHGGAEVAQYCAIHFFDSLKQTAEYKEKKYEEALRKNFLKLDAEILGPNAQKELKILSQLEPGAPLPSIEKLKSMELPAENTEEDANEARLLEEEAQMNIEDVLARYQQDVSAGWNMPPPEAATSTTAEKSPSKSSGRTKVKAHVPLQPFTKTKTEVKDEPAEVKSEEVKKETPAASAEAKEENNETAAVEDVKSSGDSVKENKKVEEESKITEDVQSSCVTSTGTSPPKKLVKVKPPKRSSKLPTADDDSEDDEDFQFGADSDDEDEEDDSEEDLDDDEDDESDEEDGEDAGEEEDPENVSYLYDYLKGSSAAMMVEVPGSDSGTTAVVALLHENRLFVANAGDSRCVVSRSGKAFDMSDDHKPEDEIELERITKAGGHVNEQGRVNGGLNLSRAIGDHCYKKNKELSLEDQMITAKPDVRIIDLTPGDDFMVLACDGVWNVMSSQEVVDFVRCRLNKDDGAAENGTTKPAKLSGICEEIFQKCLAPDTMGDGTGCDNMTCMIVRFDQKWLTSSTTTNNNNAADEKQVEKNGTSTNNNAVNGEQLHASSSPVVVDSQERKRSCDGDDDVSASKQAKSE